MQLSNEDNLRLNVLMAQNPKAIKIDESRMVLYGLTDKGEATVALNPTCKDDKYIKLVKELLSNKIMGSPGGYPVYIKRWTRMGQERREESLEQLLLLGEPEAVVAVVHAPVVTPTIAKHAWWAFPSANNARKLLDKKVVAESEIARELAEFLLEFLPFEVEHRDMIESTRLCLKPGLLSTDEINDLWKRAKRKQSLYVGFLHTLPDRLPESGVAHPSFETLSQQLQPLIEQKNIYARQLLRLLSPAGQVFLSTVKRVIDKAVSQETIVSLFIAINHYHQSLMISNYVQLNVEDALMTAEQMFGSSNEQAFNEMTKLISDHLDLITAMLVLAQMGERTLNHIFGISDALGSVMRKKLKPVTDPLTRQIDILLN